MELHTHPSAQQAFSALESGNLRFQRHTRSIEAMGSLARREELSVSPHPSAIILSCSDSRVPSETIFDCAFGEVFVVRVAGNIAAPSLVGSVEFAASTFGTELVVVMGHTGCMAVTATVQSLVASGGEPISENVRDIVERIAPAVRPLLDAGLAPEELLGAATRANVLYTADRLRHGSRVLEQRVTAGQLVIVGAEYSLATGHVDFFDVPTSLRTRAERESSPL